MSISLLLISLILPIGIPALPFGADNVKPPSTKVSTTFPTTVNGGQVISLTGTMTGGTVTCNGQLNNPAWVIGGINVNVVGGVRILGHNCIVDGVKFSGDGSVELGGTQNVLRNVESTGVLNQGPMAGIVVYGSECVVMNSKVHNHGDMNTTIDQDAHGISVVRGANRVWLLFNEAYLNSGDGINVNSFPYDSTGQTAIQQVFIGRNISHDNGQVGFWVKQSIHIIFSENESYGHHFKLNRTAGEGMGGQYGPNLVWFLRNFVHDNDVGIGVMSDLGNEQGARRIFLFGNLIYKITGTTGCGAGPVWSCAGIMLMGGADKYVINNVLSQVSDGVHSIGGRILINGTIGDQRVTSESGVAPPFDYAAVYNLFYGQDISSILNAPAAPSRLRIQ